MVFIMGSRRHALKEKLTLAIIEKPEKHIIEQMMQVEISAHSDPWTYDSLVECFTDNCRNIGLYLNRELIGFCTVCILFDEAEIYTIGILKKYQGLGFGHRLLLRSLQICRELGAERCFLEVRVSNAVALYLYDYYGFTITGTRKNYYSATSEHPAEDAYTMCCDLSTISMEDPFEPGADSTRSCSDSEGADNTAAAADAGVAAAAGAGEDASDADDIDTADAPAGAAAAAGAGDDASDADDIDAADAPAGAAAAAGACAAAAAGTVPGAQSATAGGNDSSTAREHKKLREMLADR